MKPLIIFHWVATCFFSICIGACGNEEVEPDSEKRHRNNEQDHKTDRDTRNGTVVITQQIVESTYLPLYSADDLPLNDAVNILTAESEKYAKRIGYTPVRFIANGNIADRRVTLKAKGNSLKTICSALAEQVGAELVLGDYQLEFRVPDSFHAMGGGDDQETPLPLLPSLE